jgi:putative hemolysin
MQILVEYSPWLVSMGVLILCSAFFSSSEAAFFYLDRSQRRGLASGNRAARIAAMLLADQERLLIVVLFWNLVVNLAYFTIASITSIQLERSGHATAAGLFAVGSLVFMIVLSEMLPKSLAVLHSRAVVVLLGIPLSLFARLLDPVLPAFRVLNLLSQRLLCPHFTAEPYLRVGDLERAVQLSTGDATLLQQEQQVLQNIVLLSDIRAEELMRPRRQFLSFRPPVSLDDLEGNIPPSGYLLVTESDSDEVASAIALRHLSSIPTEHLEHYAQAVAYVPWSTSVARSLEIMQRHDRQVAAVVNEFGETIGILTFDDILDTIFGADASRSERILKQEPIREVSTGVWHATGMTNVRRLARRFNVQVPPTKGVTIAGVVQEVLERLPRTGDQCRWGPFEIKVIEATQRGQLTVELTLADAEEVDS